MRIRPLDLLTVITLSLAFSFTGCSKDAPRPAIDTKPFESAIADYCQSKGFGMKVFSVERVVSKGDTATAVCKMEEIEATTTIKVRWEFTFQHTATGWQVQSHTAQ